MKALILFPRITFSTSIVDLSQEEIDKIRGGTSEEKADFVISHLNEVQHEAVDWINRKDMVGAFDTGQADISSFAEVIRMANEVIDEILKQDESSETTQST